MIFTMGVIGDLNEDLGEDHTKTEKQFSAS